MQLMITFYLLIQPPSAVHSGMSDGAVQVRRCQWSMPSQSQGHRATRRPPSHKLCRSAAMLAEQMPQAIC